MSQKKRIKSSNRQGVLDSFIQPKRSGQNLESNEHESTQQDSNEQANEQGSTEQVANEQRSNEKEVNVEESTESEIPTMSDLGESLGSCWPDDICSINVNALSDDAKFRFISNRIPEPSFQFPTKSYKDKRCKSGSFKRSCCHDWFEKFPFIVYSKSQDGLYCIACKFFPDTSGRRPSKLITEPYRNWKDATYDLKKHALTDNHKTSMARLDGFKKSCVNQSNRIDVNLTSNNAEIIAKNRNVIRSLLKCLEFCGRRGMALRGHRDDDSIESKNKGNFKELIQFRIEAGDAVLEQHLKTCSKAATYTSKTYQNELLSCVKSYIQNCIVDEVKAQPFGAYFGMQCDEVSDNSNWEQLGVVLRYVVDGAPVERLLEFVLAEETTGESLCNLLIHSVTSNGLDIQLCRSKTMDGAGNMSGKNRGCAAQLSRISPRATYHYCASHNLNLVLCKSCKVTEIHLMLDSLKQLGIFFKYSPKRSRRLETAVDEVNSRRQDGKKITKSKFKVFCETRWTEKHTTLDTFETMYEALLSCLEAISTNEGRSWDRKAITDAHGLLSKITDSTFIVCFTTVHNFFGYISGVSAKLQGSFLDIVEGYRMINDVKLIIEQTRADDNEFEVVYEKASTMAVTAGIGELAMPRRCARQTNRNNVPSNSDKEYFKRAIFIPYLDELIQQLDMRFGQQAVSVVRALALLPFRVHLSSQEIENDIFVYYEEDLPSPVSYRQEVRIWKSFWESQADKPDTITATLKDSRACTTLFPNIMKILFLLSLTSVTSSSTERANSTLKLIKSDLRSTMKEDRLNALLLLYIHRDIALDYDKIIDSYAMKNPRKMVLTNPV